MDQRPTIWEEQHASPPTYARSLVTFAVLAVLTGVALFVGFNVTGPYKVFASLAVAGVQAAIVSVFFMELRHADKLTWLLAAAGIFWTFLLFLFTLTDYLTRQWGAY